MKKSTLIDISLMTPEDREEISSWQQIYGDTAEFESIRHFILEDMPNFTLDDVLRINYEQYPIGDDEKQVLLVARNKSKELVAWMLCDCIEMTSSSPELFVQYLVVHPMHQRKGYGSAFAGEIFFHPKEYLDLKYTPKKYFAYIDNDNIASQKLVTGFGFDLNPIPRTCYSRAFTRQPKLSTGSQFGD